MGYAIQEVFEKSYPSYLASYSSYPDSHKVAQAILKCKTPLMGGNQAICQDCGTSHTH